MKWEREDDLILAEVVLGNIRSGNKIGEGYFIASERLGRTPESCSRRWNNVVKHQYPNALEIAHNYRQLKMKKSS